MSHPDVSLANILLSITRVSFVQNKFVFCQLRVHYSAIFGTPRRLHRPPSDVGHA